MRNFLILSAGVVVLVAALLVRSRSEQATAEAKRAVAEHVAALELAHADASARQAAVVDDVVALPRSRAAVIEELARGQDFVLEPRPLPQPVAGVSGYRLKQKGHLGPGADAGVTFTERAGRLTTVEVTALRDDTQPSGDTERSGDTQRNGNTQPSGEKIQRLADGGNIQIFAEIVGETVCGDLRSRCREAILQALIELNMAPGTRSRYIGKGGGRVKVEVTRHDDGRYSYRFAAEPDVEQ